MKTDHPLASPECENIWQKICVIPPQHPSRGWINSLSASKALLRCSTAKNNSSNSSPAKKAIATRRPLTAMVRQVQAFRSSRWVEISKWLKAWDLTPSLTTKTVIEIECWNATNKWIVTLTTLELYQWNGKGLISSKQLHFLILMLAIQTNLQGRCIYQIRLYLLQHLSLDQIGQL